MPCLRWYLAACVGLVAALLLLRSCRVPGSDREVFACFRGGSRKLCGIWVSRHTHFFREAIGAQNQRISTRSFRSLAPRTRCVPFLRLICWNPFRSSDCCVEKPQGRFEVVSVQPTFEEKRLLRGCFPLNKLNKYCLLFGLPCDTSNSLLGPPRKEGH